MQRVEERNQAKVDHYVDLLLDQEKLVRASRSIIRKKHSPLALKIANGNVKAIMRAAKDRISSALSREQRLDLCKILCDLRRKVISSTKKRWREFIALAVSGVVGLVNPGCGILIELLWLMRQEVQDAICSCKLSGACQKGACV
ncbi:hypothetical protein [Pseudomonas mandelii]|jgi:hypothetical protein|uniref:hypothetical protein n=1 Tax=Pseudomonas mandelii TaxID=75612 RepID=UPI003C75369F